MRKYTVRYSSDFNNELGLLPKDIAVRIIKKVGYYSNTFDPIKYAKPLTGKFHGYHRYRIGDYRVIFKIDSQLNMIVMIMLRVKHRKDIYGI